jgi:hypothetical protein
MNKVMPVLILAAVGLSLGGCGGGGSADDGGQAHVRVIHVSPATDSVSVAFGSSTFTSSLKYHTATSYQDVAEGTPELKIQSLVTGAAFVDANVTLTKDIHYTFFVYGGGTSVSTTQFSDETGDAASGKFRLRLAHFGTGLGSVDVYLLPTGSTVATSTPTYSNLAYTANIAFSDYSSGDFGIVLTPAGAKEVIYESGKQKFAEKSKVTLAVFAAGSGKLANVALVLNDGSGTTTFVDNLDARFRFIHTATDLQTADVLVDGSLTLANIPYGSQSSYSSTGAGSHNFRIQSSDTPGAYLYDQTLTLGAALDYSFVAYSTPGTGAVSIFTLEDNNLPPSSGKAKLRVVNAGSDSTAYDTYVNYSKLLSAVGQATGSAYQQLDSGTYVLSFSPAGTTTQAATLTAQTLDATHVYTVYVFGRSGAAAAVLVKDK